MYKIFKTVCVLMSTYNGEKYIIEQIRSVLNQQGVKVKLYIRDDGSTDSTVSAISSILKDKKEINFTKGKNVGYIASFLSLLKEAPKCDYYAFCDQDDVWKKDKLIKAVDMLQKEEEKKERPLLYTSSLQCTDADLTPTRIQNFSNLKLSFYSEFVRHRFAGCTYVFNKQLQEIARLCNIEETICPHDTLISLLVWACGGKTIFDSVPHILFRRHGNNESVDGMGIKRRIKKEFDFLGENKDYKFNEAKMLLHRYQHYLSPEINDFLKDFISYKDNRIIKRRMLMNNDLDCGIRLANVLFKMGLLLNSI